MDTKHELKTWICEPAVLPAVMPEDELLNMYESKTCNEAENDKILITIYTDHSIIEIELY